MMIIQHTMSKNNSKTCEENTGVAQVLKAATVNTKTEIWEVIQATEEDVAEVGHKKSLADKVTRVTINSKTDNTNLQQQVLMEASNIEYKISKECSKTS